MGIIVDSKLRGASTSLVKDFEACLESSKGERRIALFLKQHPDVILWSLLTIGGHMEYVVPEFGLGKSLRCDFVVVQSYSNGWRVEFVELEPVIDPLYNKDRTPSRRLRIAQKQIADWQNYIHDEPDSIRYQLADAIIQKDLIRPLHYEDLEPSSYAASKLRDPKSFIHFGFNIVIGRRKDVSQLGHNLRSSHNYHSDVEIISYDRLLDVAKNIDKRCAKNGGSVCLPSTEP